MFVFVQWLHLSHGSNPDREHAKHDMGQAQDQSRGNPSALSPKLAIPLGIVQEYCKFRGYRCMRMDGVPSSAHGAQDHLFGEVFLEMRLIRPELFSY